MLDKYSMPARHLGMIEEMLRGALQPRPIHFAESHFDKETSSEMAARQHLELDKSRGELHQIIGGL
jgi:hypothetical protein